MLGLFYLGQMGSREALIGIRKAAMSRLMFVVALGFAGEP